MQTLDPRAGGVVAAVKLLSEGLQRLGVEIEVAVQDPPEATWLKNLPFKVHAVGEGWTSYRYARSLKAWLKENARRFDCAIGHGIWQYHSFALRQCFHRERRPYFIFPHGMLDPWFKKTYPRKHLKKWLSWPWGDYRVLRDAAAVIFTSEEERTRARESFWLYRAKERVSPLGLDRPDFTDQNARDLFTTKFPAVAGTRMLLFLSRLHPKKGCDLLLKAWPEGEANVSLVIAGPDQIGWQKTLMTRFASPRIVFTGMLEGALKQGALESADAFILPSHQENFSLSVVEALSYGLPVFISDRINICREIEKDGAGYVESDNLEGTAQLLEKWLKLSPTSHEQMRKNARRCFANRFTLDQAAKSLVEILHSS